MSRAMPLQPLSTRSTIIAFNISVVMLASGVSGLNVSARHRDGEHTIELPAPSWYRRRALWEIAPSAVAKIANLITGSEELSALGPKLALLVRESLVEHARVCNREDRTST